MAYRLIWPSAVRDNLHDIVVFIVSMTAKENVLEKLFELLPNDSRKRAHRAHYLVFTGRDNTSLLSMNDELIAWYLSAAATI